MAFLGSTRCEESGGLREKESEEMRVDESRLGEMGGRGAEGEGGDMRHRGRRVCWADLVSENEVEVPLQRRINYTKCRCTVHMTDSERGQDIFRIKISYY